MTPRPGLLRGSKIKNYKGSNALRVTWSPPPGFSIYNYDFEEFLLKTNPTENDFIFLDPPYDSKFSSYDNNEFNRNDHKRLADYLLNKCKAKWMMIISKTDFIYDLYNQPGIHIQEYDKKYTCNTKGWKNRDVIHLLITNYDTSEVSDSKDMEHNLAA